MHLNKQNSTVYLTKGLLYISNLIPMQGACSGHKDNNPYMKSTCVQCIWSFNTSGNCFNPLSQSLSMHEMLEPWYTWYARMLLTCLARVGYGVMYTALAFLGTSANNLRMANSAQMVLPLPVGDATSTLS